MPLNNLPPDFVTRTQALTGNEFARFEAALQADVPVSIRINKGKGVRTVATGEAVAWSDTGYYLPERLAFTFDPLFHAGTYYVQEAASMFLEQAIRRYVVSPVTCLDLCAAPGGKSTHLSALLPEGSLLVGNEVIRSRSLILAENLIKWGNPHTVVTRNDPEEIGRLTHLFDLVVADVPCSGEGMFRKEPGSMAGWSVAGVSLCAARQRRIIRDVWDALKPGGLLIYSTCTYNTEENEENIQYITEELGAEALPVPVREEWKITPALRYNHPACRFFPHKTRGEGFFLAVLRKAEGRAVRLKSQAKKEKAGTIPAHILHWLRQPEEFLIEAQGDTLYALPAVHAETCRLMAGRLRILSSGVRLGEVKGKDVIPCHALAMSVSRHPGAFPTAGLTPEEAIRFLKKETFPLRTEEKGYILATFKGYPLGFLKNLGARANNLYPPEWRIRTGRLPEKMPASPVL